MSSRNGRRHQPAALSGISLENISTFESQAEQESPPRGGGPLTGQNLWREGEEGKGRHGTLWVLGSRAVQQQCFKVATLSVHSSLAGLALARRPFRCCLGTSRHAAVPRQKSRESYSASRPAESVCSSAPCRPHAHLGAIARMSFQACVKSSLLHRTAPHRTGAGTLSLSKPFPPPDAKTKTVHHKQCDLAELPPRWAFC